MQAVSLPASVRDQIGDDAAAAFEAYLGAARDEWRADVLNAAADRFERGLNIELAAMRVEMGNGFSAMRREMGDLRVEWLKWSFLFWLGQVAVLTGVMALLLKAAPR
jgi:hypothetical protein